MASSLHVGAQIYISEGEGEGATLGVLSVGGVQMGAREVGALGATFSSEAVFLVRQQHTYAAAKQIRSLVESDGRTYVELAADPAHRRLFEGERARTFRTSQP